MLQLNSLSPLGSNLGRAAVLTLALGGTALAQNDATDRIYLTDGTIIKEVSVSAEGLTEVEYKEGRSKSTVASDRVLRIDYGRKPKLVDQADGLASDEAYLDAIAEMSNYLGEVEDKPDRRFPWAAAYARYRLIEFNRIIGDVEALNGAAEELIGNNPDSRYAPLAFVARAQVLSDNGDLDGAKKAVEAFGNFVDAKSLAGRWPIEQKLWDALTSGKSGKALEDALADVSSSAAQFPTVRNRAEVAIADSMFRRDEVDEAEKIFREIVDDTKADSRTLAAAWTGLGDCLYSRAGGSTDGKEDHLRAALKAYLRVVVLYEDEFLYVPKAAFYAGRCYSELPDEEAADRARKLYIYVIRNFPGGRWAREARNFAR